MKAIAVYSGTPNSMHLEEVGESDSLLGAKAHDVEARLSAVGDLSLLDSGLTAVQTAQELTVVTGCTVERVILGDGRATGVLCRDRGGTDVTVEANVVEAGKRRPR
jgi:GMC oxidoreductase